jgi:hypothetical protein
LPPICSSSPAPRSSSIRPPAKHYGAVLVLINREPTGLDNIADLVLHRAIGETLGEIVGVE